MEKKALASTGVKWQARPESTRASFAGCANLVLGA
jgi:hypothetical protein